MQNKKISLEQLTDIVGFRILLNSVEDCYKTLGILHSKYSAIPENLKIIFLRLKSISINPSTLL